MNQTSYNFLGIHAQALTITELNSLIGTAVKQDEKWIIANHNLHSLYLYHHQPKMQDFYAKADYTHIDGMALVLLGQRLGLPLQREHRVTYADWVWPLMADASQQGWRIFYLGSKPGVAETGATILRNKFPGLEIMTTHGYINPSADSQENQEVLAKIKAYQPHILMVGMGMPRQENWILDNLEQICANVILPSGACIDYVAGAIPTPPRWMGRLGFEWLYRLLSEPKRLWKRYLLEPWFILKLFLQEMLIKQFKTN
ncbi:WecB/TagA/CpsF family glycosyltransferase [Anabaena sphaerica FACHB-251]|uniref:WecB/TagA/CpsF family glycosyltransferase n=1 Tax=Anabaena sphaerica FACHB-251 TaxID=2692883 RepID=A0A926WL02_9NOST|nr:WecB/TagA/CpsF family glycosyltransferase [Anabaena sphaerica]MBD2295930.1 WecB/TagA/CpsF family glycosyltransferase [Anabaena sphaerica FACHB-251]